MNAANRLIIDTTTTSAPELVRRLRAHPATVMVQEPTAYREDPTLSLVRLTTHLNEFEMEDWLYKEKGIDYIGVTEDSPE